MFSAFLNMFRQLFVALTTFSSALTITAEITETLATAGKEASNALLDEQRAQRALNAVESKKKLAVAKAA